MQTSATPPRPARPEDSVLLRDAIESLSEGFALFDAEQKLVMFNRRCGEINHLIADLMVTGVTWATLVRAGAERRQCVIPHGDNEAWIEDILRRGVNMGQDIEIEYTDGQIYLVSLNATNLGGFVVTHTDITERRHAEAVAREQEEVLQTVLDTLPVAMVMARLEDGKIIYRSPAAKRAFGRTTNAREHYVDPQDRLDYVAALSETGKLDDYRLPQLGQSGNAFPASISGRLVEFNGETCVVSSIMDLTEQQERETLIRKVMEACPIPIQMTRAETGEVLFSSPETISLFGEVDTAKRFYVDPETRRRYLAKLRENGYVTEHKAQLYNAQGEPFWGAISARLIDYNGEQVIVSHTRDMTEQLRIESELTSQQALLFQNEKMSALGELLAGVAHELNNPLSVVVGHALMLQEDVTDPEIARQIDKISTAAERCAKIVKTFLTMARQQPGRMERVSANEIVQTAADVARYGDMREGLAIECDLTPDLPEICADPDQVTQVIVNLILNAEQAIRNGGKGDRITVRTRRGKREDTVEIDVEDNGPGIPAPIRERIFEPFFTTKDVGEGTGIGLALCHRIIRSHDGQITLEFSGESGTRFRVELPVREAADATSTEDETDDVKRRPARRVMIVDDEMDVAELNAEILMRDGYDVEICNTADGALEKLRESRFDLVLSDLNMPGIDGRGFYEAITRDHPHLAERTGFVTGDTMGRASQKFLGEADCPYLEKPVSPKELRAFVAGLLGQPGVAA